jgi:type IV secretory pathway TrbD component
LALVVGQATGVLYLGVGTVMLVGTLIWIVDIILLRISIRSFKRSMLITKL